jgi:hypothetical protein
LAQDDKLTLLPASFDGVSSGLAQTNLGMQREVRDLLVQGSTVYVLVSAPSFPEGVTVTSETLGGTAFTLVVVSVRGTETFDPVSLAATESAVYFSTSDGTIVRVKRKLSTD